MSRASSQPTLGLAVLAKDEQENLPHLLASVVGAFDQVALLDTGSSDRTVEVFEEWAQAQDLLLGHRVGRFEWCDDFAAARNAADELLATDWLCWADCDDVIVGAEKLRPLAARAERFAALACSYVLGSDEEGLRHRMHRPRLVRRGAGCWIGRVHESVVISGQGAFVSAAFCEWRHRRVGGPTDSRRNLAILRRWVEEEPENSRAQALLVCEEVMDDAAGAPLAALADALDLLRLEGQSSPEVACAG